MSGRRETRRNGEQQTRRANQWNTNRNVRWNGSERVGIYLPRRTADSWNTTGSSTPASYLRPGERRGQHGRDPLPPPTSNHRHRRPGVVSWTYLYLFYDTKPWNRDEVLSYGVVYRRRGRYRSAFAEPRPTKQKDDRARARQRIRIDRENGLSKDVAEYLTPDFIKRPLVRVSVTRRPRGKYSSRSYRRDDRPRLQRSSDQRTTTGDRSESQNPTGSEL